MKKSSYKIPMAIFAATLVMFVMASCGEDGGDDGRNSTYVPPASVAFLEKSYTINAVGAERYELTVVKSSSVAATATLTSSQTVVDEYNNTFGTIYAAVPSDKYHISATTVSFSATETRKSVEITWDEDEILGLDAAYQYVIPVKLSADSATAVSETNEYFLLYLTPIVVSMQSTTLPDLYPKMGVSESVKNTIMLNVPFQTDELAVEYKVDPSLVAAYNAANGTNFATPPAGYVSLSSTSETLENTVVIPAGKTSVNFSIFLDADDLFGANGELVSGSNYLIPVAITSLSLDGIELTNDVMYLTIRQDKEIMGPWTVLEGAEFALPNDPHPESYNTDTYAVSSLFNGKWLNEGGYEVNTWASWFNTPNVFPIAFVVDMGKTYAFTKFRIIDARAYQSALRNYEIYMAETYAGADTEWRLVAKGLRDGGWFDHTPGIGGIYDYPPASGEMHRLPGRYLKFVLLNHERAQAQWTGDYINGRAKLAEVYGLGIE